MASSGVNGNGVHANDTPQSFYKVKEAPVGTSRHLRVVMLGAGASGLNLAHQMELHMKDYDLTIYEKNEDVGGTWFENRYPGVACDIPAHSYQFAWEPNPNWSAYYAPGPEIFQYFQGVAKKYDLYRWIKLNHMVTSAIWDEESATWKLEIQNTRTGEIVKDWAHVFINGGGFLNKWKWPNIEGLHSFKGELIHSARWPESFDPTGKDIVVLGNGSSGIQIVPSLQPKAKSLTTFIRSPTWITPSFAGKIINEDGSNLIFTEKEKQRFREDPKHYLEYRRRIDYELHRKYRAVMTDSKEQKMLREAATKEMKDALKNNERIINAIMPDFAVCCRRPTPGVGYLEALIKDNVNVVVGGIQKVTPDGIITTDGQVIKADAFVCATGFDVSFCPRFEFVGRDGVRLADQWKDKPRAYLSMAVENFPNYFMYLGPNAPVGQGSIISVIEQLTRYIINFMIKMQTQNIKSAAPSKAAVDDLDEHTTEYMKRTAFASKCNSWFKNGKIDGPVIAIYPGSRMHFNHMTSELRGEDWEFTYTTKNRFAWMGNGFSTREEEGLDLSPELAEPYAGFRQY